MTIEPMNLWPMFYRDCGEKHLPMFTSRMISKFYFDISLGKISYSFLNLNCLGILWHFWGIPWSWTTMGKGVASQPPMEFAPSKWWLNQPKLKNMSQNLPQMSQKKTIYPNLQIFCNVFFWSLLLACWVKTPLPTLEAKNSPPLEGSSSRWSIWTTQVK